MNYQAAATEPQPPSRSLAWVGGLSALALAVSFVIAFPIGLYFGHRGVGEFLAVALGNAGRAIPELALIAFMAAFIGVGLINVTLALAVLGIPPILTNTFVAIRGVEPGAIEAARGMGMSEAEVMRRVELPLAVRTIMSVLSKREPRADTMSSFSVSTLKRNTASLPVCAELCHALSPEGHEPTSAYVMSEDIVSVLPTYVTSTSSITPTSCAVSIVSAVVVRCL